MRNLQSIARDLEDLVCVCVSSGSRGKTKVSFARARVARIYLQGIERISKTIEDLGKLLDSIRRMRTPVPI